LFDNLEKTPDLGYRWKTSGKAASLFTSEMIDTG
jgi:hypothetical protein